MSTSSLRSQMIDFWGKEADPFVSTLFGIQSPGSFLTLVAGITLLIKRNEWNSRTEKEPIYVKPALLVLYGLLFGVSGAGFLLALAATEGGQDCFGCGDRQVLSIKTVSMRYLGYAYLCTLLFEFWILSLEAAQGRVQTTVKLARHITWLLTTFLALKYLPVGYYAFCPLMHCILRTMTFGTNVLESASAELNFLTPSWRSSMRMIESFCWAVVSAQQFWVYNTLQCDLSIVNLLGAVAAAFNSIAILME